jgi:superfamily I DNA/RNA helicase
LQADAAAVDRHFTASRTGAAHARREAAAEAFQILDSEDQQRLLRRIIRDEGMDEAQWPARQAQWFINARATRVSGRSTSSTSTTR